MSEQKLRSRGRPWPKGVSGNPNGRKPRSQNHDTIISEATRRGLELMTADGKLTVAEALALRRAEIGLRAKPGIALAAINSIEDRMEGKATQSIKVTQGMDEDTARRIVEIGEMLAIKGIFEMPKVAGKRVRAALSPSNAELSTAVVINAESNSDSGAPVVEPEGACMQVNDSKVVS